MPDLSEELDAPLKSRVEADDIEGAIERIYQLLWAGRSVGEIISDLGTIAHVPKEAVGNSTVASTNTDPSTTAPVEEPSGSPVKTPPRIANPTVLQTKSSPAQPEPAGAGLAEVDNPSSDAMGNVSSDIASGKEPAKILPQIAKEGFSPLFYPAVMAAGLLAGVSIASLPGHFDSTLTAAQSPAAIAPVMATQHFAGSEPADPVVGNRNSVTNGPEPGASEQAVANGTIGAEAALPPPISENLEDQSVASSERKPGVDVVEAKTNETSPSDKPSVSTATKSVELSPEIDSASWTPLVLQGPVPTVPEGKISARRLAPEEATVLVTRGDAVLRTRDVTSARLFYRAAADAGDSTAALHLGATFDPDFLQAAGLGPVIGDLRQALNWYRRARDLGNTDAEILLRRMESAGK